jgi:tRNA (cmo5U34)-methyltransferase
MDEMELQDKGEDNLKTTKLEEMSEFFNSRAKIYDEKHIEHIGGGIESKHIIASFFPPYTKTMIDLGIGTGLELEAIFKRFPEIEITGLDIAENMLKLLREKYPDKIFICIVRIIFIMI